MTDSSNKQRLQQPHNDNDNRPKKTNNNNYTVSKHKLKHEDPNSQINEITPESCLQEATHSNEGMKKQMHRSFWYL